MPNDPLDRYHFVYDHGQPLENCVEYRELLAEVERLRGEVARLNEAVNRWQDEYESAQRCADVATQQVRLLAKKLFDNHICHKAVLCKQGNINGRKFEGEDGCGFCWEEWSWHLAAYDIDEDARKSVEDENG